MRVRVMIMLGAAASVGACARGSETGASAPPELRAFALCACLAAVFPGTPTADAAEAAAGAYLERGELPFEAYAAAAERAAAFSERPRPSKSGANLALMNCVDLYEDPGLDELARRAARGELEAPVSPPDEP